MRGCPRPDQEFWGILEEIDCHQQRRREVVVAVDNMVLVVADVESWGVGIHLLSWCIGFVARQTTSCWRR